MRNSIDRWEGKESNVWVYVCERERWGRENGETEYREGREEGESESVREVDIQNDR